MYVDSFTGERLFGQPWIEGNLVAYERGDLSKKAAQFKNQNLFILHGTADGQYWDPGFNWNNYSYDHIVNDNLSSVE